MAELYSKMYKQVVVPQQREREEKKSTRAPPPLPPHWPALERKQPAPTPAPLPEKTQAKEEVYRQCERCDDGMAEIEDLCFDCHDFLSREADEKAPPPAPAPLPEKIQAKEEVSRECWLCEDEDDLGGGTCKDCADHLTKTEEETPLPPAPSTGITTSLVIRTGDNQSRIYSVINTPITGPTGFVGRLYVQVPDSTERTQCLLKKFFDDCDMLTAEEQARMDEILCLPDNLAMFPSEVQHVPNLRRTYIQELFFIAKTPMRAREQAAPPQRPLPAAAVTAPQPSAQPAEISAKEEEPRRARVQCTSMLPGASWEVAPIRCPFEALPGSWICSRCTKEEVNEAEVAERAARLARKRVQERAKETAAALASEKRKEPEPKPPIKCQRMWGQSKCTNDAIPGNIICGICLPMVLEQQARASAAKAAAKHKAYYWCFKHFKTLEGCRFGEKCRDSHDIEVYKERHKLSWYNGVMDDYKCLLESRKVYRKKKRGPARH